MAIKTDFLSQVYNFDVSETLHSDQQKRQKKTAIYSSASTQTKDTVAGGTPDACVGP